MTLLTWPPWMVCCRDDDCLKLFGSGGGFRVPVDLKNARRVRQLRSDTEPDRGWATEVGGSADLRSLLRSAGQETMEISVRGGGRCRVGARVPACPRCRSARQCRRPRIGTRSTRRRNHRVERDPHLQHATSPNTRECRYSSCRTDVTYRLAYPVHRSQHSVSW